MSKLKHVYTECDCGSDEHVIRFTFDEDDGDLYMSVFLNQYQSWWQRIWIAVKYVFGYKSKYGHFDCTCISGDETVKLASLFTKAAKVQKQHQQDQQ